MLNMQMADSRSTFAHESRQKRCDRHLDSMISVEDIEKSLRSSTLRKPFEVRLTDPIKSFFIL